MIFILMLLLLSVSCGIAIYKKHRRFGIALFIFSLGLFLMLISSKIYNIHRGLYSQSWLSENYGFSHLAQKMNLSFRNLKIMSGLGQGFSLYAVSYLYCTGLKRRKWVYMFWCALTFIYVILNMPDIAYSLSLVQNTAAGRNMYRFLLLMKHVIVWLFLLCPILTCIYEYNKKKFLIIKRKIISLALCCVLCELLLLILVNTEHVDSFFHLSLNIFYMDNSKIMVSDRLLLGIFIVFLPTLLFVMLKSGLFTLIPSQIEERIFGKSKNLDFIMRMVLHSYKNMFLSVNQLSEFALKSTDPHGGQVDELLDSINKLSSSALYQIVHQIDMLGNPNIVYKASNLNNIINDTLEKMSIPKNVNITIYCAKSDFIIYSDELYLSEILHNLLINACDAVKNVPEPHIDIKVESEDSWVLIEIIDNGCGIDPKLINQIFNPMVSYKLGKNNWGIGLYYVKKIVRAHNGYIFIDSKLKQYTKFSIFLPLEQYAEKADSEI